AQEQEVARLQEALAASHQEAEAARLQVEQQGVELSQIQAALRAAQAAQEQEVARLQEMLRQQEVEVVRLGRELARRAGWRGALREGLGFNNPHPSLLSRGIRRGVRTIRQIRRQFRSHQSVPYAPSFGSADKNRIVMLVPDNLIDRRVLLEGQALTQAGCEVTVIAAPAPENIPVDDADFPDLTIVRVNPMAAVQIPPELDCLNALPKRDWNDFYWLTDHYYLEAVTRPAEVYVAHDLPVLAAAAKAAAKHSAMLVYDAHELYPEQHVFSPTVKMMLADAEALLVPKVHHGTTVNLSLAQEMSKRYGGSPFEVILNAPAWPAEVMTQTHDSLRAALEIQPYHKVLLFQGGFSPYRNLENVVKAMARVRNEQIVLVLIGQGELRPELTEIAQRLGLLDSRVFFHPFVPQKSLLAYTRSADAGIIPYPHIDLNSYYCTPNKLFEYLVVGIPILANDSPELRRFVGELGVGLNVPMNDDCEIASGIDQLFSDSVLLKKFRIRSEEVGRQFTWEREAEKLRDLYASWIKEWCQTKRKLA
ncbi:MAG: glycosyltransferase, partial [Candidatus Methylomirabilis oxyfera]|nr:glycosyltransferase [Candidatus Methylomirabilis oxyfera]